MSAVVLVDRRPLRGKINNDSLLTVTFSCHTSTADGGAISGAAPLGSVSEQAPTDCNSVFQSYSKVVVRAADTLNSQPVTHNPIWICSTVLSVTLNCIFTFCLFGSFI